MKYTIGLSVACNEEGAAKIRERFAEQLAARGYVDTYYEGVMTLSGGQKTLEEVTKDLEFISAFPTHQVRLSKESD